jgi:hypothetical protein
MRARSYTALAVVFFLSQGCATSSPDEQTTPQDDGGSDVAVDTGSGADTATIDSSMMDATDASDPAPMPTPSSIASIRARPRFSPSSSRSM